MILRNACAVIAHNEEIQKLAQERLPDAHPITIRDPVDSICWSVPRNPNQVLFVCSFDSGEPVEIFPEIVGSLPEYNFYVTADPLKLPRGLRAAMRSLPNLTFTGFLPAREYQELLCSSAVAVVLEKTKSTQPSGACEALSSDTPLVLTRSTLTATLFGKWAYLVNHDSNEIAAAIRKAALEQLDLSRYRQRWNTDVDAAIVELRDQLGQSAGSGAEAAESGAPEQSSDSGPLVSVIMPVLNAGPFLKESIDSVLSQSFRQFELIIVDNGSTDGSKECAESFSDTRIQVLTELRRGTAHAINTGIAASRAELLAIMDADDIASPERLAVQVAYMREHPETVLLGARFTFLVGNQLVPVAPPLVHHRQIRKALLQSIPAICNGTTMFRADAAKRVGGHSINGPSHDLDFFLRMSEVGVVHNLPVTLYHYRLHERASTAIRTPFTTEHQMFAVACARARGAGVPEPKFADFRREWSIRSGLAKLAGRGRDLSLQLYRHAIIKRGNGKIASAGVAATCSAVLNPRLVIWRIKRQLSNVDNQIHMRKS
jgi:glycosyltransferase involved in cell wall biosynthesis